jgi:hypothetical protein
MNSVFFPADVYAIIAAPLLMEGPPDESGKRRKIAVTTEALRAAVKAGKFDGVVCIIGGDSLEGSNPGPGLDKTWKSQAAAQVSERDLGSFSGIVFSDDQVGGLLSADTWHAALADWCFLMVAEVEYEVVPGLDVVATQSITHVDHIKLVSPHTMPEDYPCRVISVKERPSTSTVATEAVSGKMLDVDVCESVGGRCIERID